MQAQVVEDNVTVTSWHSYPKAYNLGHRVLQDLFTTDVLVEEKVDGSQFSFGKFKTSSGGYELRARSKGQTIPIETTEHMFAEALATVRSLEPLLRKEWTYRGEYLQKRKHNTYCYDRIPEKHIIIFDINPEHEAYLSYEDKVAEAKRLGLETVPCLFNGKVSDVNMFKDIIDTQSILGGQLVEGVVIKNYNLFGPDGKALMGKYVSEKFREAHHSDWKERSPGQNDIILKLVDELRTQARWMKAIQHLRERGELQNAPQDIGPLLKEISKDTHDEEKEYIKEKLFAWAWKNISRGLTRGFPEWYKEQLLEKQFEQEENSHDGR